MVHLTRLKVISILNKKYRSPNMYASENCLSRFFILTHPWWSNVSSRRSWSGSLTSRALRRCGVYYVLSSRPEISSGTVIKPSPDLGGTTSQKRGENT